MRSTKKRRKVKFSLSDWDYICLMPQRTQKVQPTMNQIDCPLCGTAVAQIASATLSLALWQHVNWVCKAYKAKRVVNLGVIEFHSERVNPGLMKRFYEVVKDLRDSGSIIDIWLMDIASVLGEFGYRMTVSTDKPLPRPVFEKQP